MPDLFPNNQRMFSISVVIPTLGNESLRQTIEQLNRGTLIPDEILICIPEEDAFRVEDISTPNVIVVKTDIRGQVAQRAIGFGRAKHAMVLQLDDDIILHENALAELAQSLQRLGRGYALAPLYIDAETGRCLHELSTGLKGCLKSIYAYVICGAPWGKKRMGTLTPLGIGYGVDASHNTNEAIRAEWLPGGCVLSYREDLITTNIYPFGGKAYSEDIIHSITRRKKGITHCVIPKATCMTPPQQLMLDLQSNRADMRARMHVVRLISGSAWRLSVWLAFDILKRVCIKIYLRGHQNRGSLPND